ncbi:cytochrome P450 [Streptomyces sp. NPDC059578]|uniref:cytochrome P450 n=1 Tax=Streptomyces sp. NPDC059578 TaxID=3346874 RepID=UPI00369B5416
MPRPTVPLAPGHTPLLGHLVPFLRAPLPFLRSLTSCGDLVELRLAGQRMTLVCDADLTDRLLVNDRAFDKGGPLYDRLREAGGNGVATCPAHEHRRQRRLVQPAFRTERFPGYARIMSQRMDTVIRGLRPGSVVDLARETRRITADVLISTVFGAEVSPHVHAQLAADLKELAGGILRRSLMPKPVLPLPTPGNVRYRRASRRSQRIMLELIRRHRADPTAGRAGLLSILIDAHDPDSERQTFTDEEIADQAVTFYVAGTETTAGSVCWAVYLAALHPAVRRRLTHEAREVLAGRTATWEDLDRLVYTRQTLTEALRMYPPGWFLTRETTAATRLGNHDLPAGTTIAFSPYLATHEPSRYPDPDRFDPDRWTPHEDGAPPPVPSVVFGGGARKCIGDEFAILEGTLMLASLTSHWDLRLQPDSLGLPRLPHLTLSPGRMNARIERHTAPAADGPAEAAAPEPAQEGKGEQRR